MLERLLIIWWDCHRFLFFSPVNDISQQISTSKQKSSTEWEIASSKMYEINEWQTNRRSFCMLWIVSVFSGVFKTSTEVVCTNKTIFQTYVRQISTKQHFRSILSNYSIHVHRNSFRRMRNLVAFFYENEESSDKQFWLCRTKTFRFKVEKFFFPKFFHSHFICIVRFAFYGGFQSIRMWSIYRYSSIIVRVTDSEMDPWRLFMSNWLYVWELIRQNKALTKSQRQCHRKLDFFEWPTAKCINANS